MKMFWVLVLQALAFGFCMGKDYSYRLHGQHLPWQSPNLNCTSGPPNSGCCYTVHPVNFSAYPNPSICPASLSGTLPGFAVYKFPELKSVGGNESQTCYFGYPLPTSDNVLGERFSVDPHDPSKAAPIADEKRYIIFDHSNNRTSVIFSSVGYPIQYPYHLGRKLDDAVGFQAELPVIREPFIPSSVKLPNWCESNENHETEILYAEESEMHEDTEELDALLYSDDDEEEASTGHSPSEMTAYERKREINDDPEVASSITPTKRRRLDEEVDESLMDTASSGKAWGDVDDAESSCVKGMVPLLANKQIKKRRIREAVGMLRNIIPGGKGKDAVAVLDEAIQYLKSFGFKAKAMGAAVL